SFSLDSGSSLGLVFNNGTTVTTLAVTGSTTLAGTVNITGANPNAASSPFTIVTSTNGPVSVAGISLGGAPTRVAFRVRHSREHRPDGRHREPHRVRWNGLGDRNLSRSGDLVAHGRRDGERPVSPGGSLHRKHRRQHRADLGDLRLAEPRTGGGQRERGQQLA